jgi:hypothetical protein
MSPTYTGKWPHQGKPSPRPGACEHPPTVGGAPARTAPVARSLLHGAPTPHPLRPAPPDPGRDPVPGVRARGSRPTAVPRRRVNALLTPQMGCFSHVAGATCELSDSQRVFSLRRALPPAFTLWFRQCYSDARQRWSPGPPGEPGGSGEGRASGGYSPSTTRRLQILAASRPSPRLVKGWTCRHAPLIPDTPEGADWIRMGWFLFARRY